MTITTFNSEEMMISQMVFPETDEALKAEFGVDAKTIFTSGVKVFAQLAEMAGKDSFDIPVGDINSPLEICGFGMTEAESAIKELGYEISDKKISEYPIENGFKILVEMENGIKKEYSGSMPNTILTLKKVA